MTGMQTRKSRGTAVGRPMRTCVGCRRAVPSSELVRLVLDSDGRVHADLRASAFGRGAWVHPRFDCVSKASPGLSRGFRKSVRVSAAELVSALRAGADRRLPGLISAAWRARKLSVGSTPTRHALDSGKARLLVVASDARASIRTPWVEAAIKAGKVMAWGSKADLGSLTSRAEVGIVAILDDRLAAEVARSLVIRSMPQPDSDANHRQEGG